MKYPIPIKDELIRRIRGKQVFSKFDLKSGFWQLKIHLDDRYKTAFIMPQGMYQWVVMPFGLKTAPSEFQERTDTVFFDIRDCSIAYIDDILVFSDNFPNHIRDLKRFIKCVRKHGLVLSLTKCRLFIMEAEFLGIKICKGIVLMQEHVLTKLSEFPDQLTDFKMVQSFVGCLVWITSQYPFLANDLLPFKQLQRSKTFFWKEELTKATKLLKWRCKSLQPMKLPDKGQLIIYSDASKEAWGGILCEEQPNGNLLICKYASGCFDDAEP